MEEFTEQIHGVAAGSKPCATCCVSLLANEENFYKRKRANGRVYLSSSCKSCVRLDRRQSREENPGAHLESMRRSYAKHKDKYNETRRLKIAANPELREKNNALSSAWYLENRDHVKAYRMAANLERQAVIAVGAQAIRVAPSPSFQASKRNKRARRLGAEGIFTVHDLRTRFREQSGRCFWCRRSIEQQFHVDHYLPISKGGCNKPYNIVLACQDCNLSRGAKLPQDFFQYLRSIQARMPEIIARRDYLRVKMREHRQRKAVVMPH